MFFFILSSVSATCLLKSLRNLLITTMTLISSLVNHDPRKDPVKGQDCTMWLVIYHHKDFTWNQFLLPSLTAAGG